MEEQNSNTNEKISRQATIVGELMQAVQSGKVEGMIISFSVAAPQEDVEYERHVVYTLDNDKWGLIGFTLAGVNAFSVDEITREEEEDDEDA